MIIIYCIRIPYSFNVKNLNTVGAYLFTKVIKVVAFDEPLNAVDSV